MRTRYIIFTFICVTTIMPVFAQDVLEEIVVTAQRREQNLQEVPVSVTAFTGAQIARDNITAARDYLALTPNVTFTDDGQTGSKGLGIAVRGVGNLVTGENAVVNSVGIYLDGFSVASVPNQVANPTLPDMQSIEVLRGPQGTFFGRNSVGGALNLRSNDPNLDEFGAKVIVGGETYEDANELGRFTGIVNVPLTDNLAVRGVIQYEDSGGRVKNVCGAGASSLPVGTSSSTVGGETIDVVDRTTTPAAGGDCPSAGQQTSMMMHPGDSTMTVEVPDPFTPSGSKNSGHEEIFFRGKVLWNATDVTTVKGIVTYTDFDQGHDENVPSGIFDVDTHDTLGLERALDGGPGFWSDGNYSRTSHDLPEFNKNESLLGIINIEHQLTDSLTITSISGFIDAENSRLFDQDAVGGVDTIRRSNLYEGTSWSSELRLDYSGDLMDWTVGLLYAKDDQEQTNLIQTTAGAGQHAVFEPGSSTGIRWGLPPFAGFALAHNLKSFELENKSIFGDITYHATDRLDLIAGGRVSWDDVDREIDDQRSNRPASSAKADFTDFAPRVGARFQVTDEVNLYAMVSKGYKPGGHTVGNDSVNTVPVDPDDPDAGTIQPAFQTPYDKEVLWNYELGFKSELLGDQLRLNASFFYSDWEDMQFESTVFLTPGDLTTSLERTINISEAEAAGVEVEFLGIISDAFTVSGGLGYLTTEIKSNQTVVLSGNWEPELRGLDLPKAPELTLNLAGEYRFPVGGNGEGWVRLEYIHRDGQYSDIEGVTNLQLNGLSPNNQSTIAGGGDAVPHNSGPNEFPYLSPDYDVLNIRVGVEWEQWSATGFVQNLTGENYYTGTQENFGVGGIRLRPNPRTFGINFSYAFGNL
ncbi:MAG: TonB-dependent receptor [Gammaproteobacteria bacterium]